MEYSLIDYEATSDESEDENDGVGEMSFEQPINECYVRKTSTEFSGCLLSCSVAGSSLRSDFFCLYAKRLSKSYQKFASCTHDSESVCDSCVSELKSTTQVTEELIPSAARLATCICEAGLMNSNSALRKLCAAVHRVLEVSLCVSRGISPEFDAH